MDCTPPNFLRFKSSYDTGNFVYYAKAIFIVAKIEIIHDN